MISLSCFSYRYKRMPVYSYVGIFYVVKYNPALTKRSEYRLVF